MTTRPDTIDLTALPKVGDYITEGMGTYLVRKALGGTKFGVTSHLGTSLIIDFANSDYRAPRNAWRVCRTKESK